MDSNSVRRNARQRRALQGKAKNRKATRIADSMSRFSESLWTQMYGIARQRSAEQFRATRIGHWQQWSFRVVMDSNARYRTARHSNADCRFNESAFRVVMDSNAGQSIARQSRVAHGTVEQRGKDSSLPGRFDLELGQ